MKHYDKSIVGEKVNVFVSIPCIECYKFFEINAENAIGKDELLVECPRCGHTRIVNALEHLPHRVVRED
jgi:DNA-directed RNA polymerase subunit RPC12/RpoP